MASSNDDDEKKIPDDPKKGVVNAINWKHGEDSDRKRWGSLMKILTRPSTKFAPEPFNPSEENLNIIQEDFRVLVIGAGGLGCEILKDLALSGFKDIEVIDLDTIELSNLNRQFLFREKDIGQPKAKVAAKFVCNRVPGVTIKWHQKPIQEYGEGFYKKFNCVIAGLDNVEARRWLNATLSDLVEFDEEGQIVMTSVIPFVDGGTEGFKGQVRLFIPMISSCFECSIGTLTPERGFAMCTIASIPRRPEHCIAYAHKILWPRLISLTSATKYEMAPVKDKNTKDPCGVKLDTDDVQHMSWLYQRALERAKEFNIEGVTYNMTMQVVKNIIPAIASTNALIAASCVNETFKALSWCGYGLNNYYFYNGHEGIYTRTFDYKKNPQCPVCGTESFKYNLDPNTTFKNLYHKICNDPDLKLKNPSISTTENKPLFLSNEALRGSFESNFDKTIQSLFPDNTVLQITDKKVLPKKSVKVKIIFEEGAIYVPPSED